MSHSVEKHLAVAPTIYDVEIRRFVPGYDEMLGELEAALAEHLPSPAAHVLDLGAGTGALSARLATRFPHLRLTLVDVDPEMLAQASLRLEPQRARVELRRGSFADPLPACDAAVASLSLHHLHAREAKVAVYRNVRASLAAGGVLLSGDAFVPAASALAEPLMKRWAAHLVAGGDTEEQAFARFAEWAAEDRYLGVEEELDALREAGFSAVELRWRRGPVGVLLARR